MNSGPELDILIHKHIMNPTKGEIKTVGVISPYSTSIAHAWEVVEKMKETHAVIITQKANKYVVEVKDYRSFPEHRPDADVTTPTAPHAICLAALKAKGIDVDKK